jgi:hypothetical protein
MNTFVIVSNNPQVCAKYSSFVQRVCETDEQVMITSRDLIHQGYLLVTHPLAGSVKPAQTPYRSIILQEHATLDEQSLEIMEHALLKFYQFKRTPASAEYQRRFAADFQAVDCALIDSAVLSLQEREQEDGCHRFARIRTDGLFCENLCQSVAKQE